MKTTTITETSNAATLTADLKLEAVVIPVADVDRSKAFYEGLGWRLDADFAFENADRESLRPGCRPRQLRLLRHLP